MNKRIILFFVSMFLFLILAEHGSCFIFGPSNFDPLNEYPKHKCGYGPMKPPPPDYKSSFEVKMYRHGMERYNMEIITYSMCLKDYVEAAKNDIKKINKIIDETISEHNRTINER